MGSSSCPPAHFNALPPTPAFPESHSCNTWKYQRPEWLSGSASPFCRGHVREGPQFILHSPSPETQCSCLPPRAKVTSLARQKHLEEQALWPRSCVLFQVHFFFFSHGVTATLKRQLRYELIRFCRLFLLFFN